MIMTKFARTITKFAKTSLQNIKSRHNTYRNVNCKAKFFIEKYLIKIFRLKSVKI